MGRWKAKAGMSGQFGAGCGRSYLRKPAPVHGVSTILFWTGLMRQKAICALADLRVKSAPLPDALIRETDAAAEEPDAHPHRKGG